jgi:hypothetical protein
MKVLVATKDGQGLRKNDFSHTNDGEFVGFVFECEGEQVDGSCGCRRAFGGLSSHKSTTTAKVVQKELTEGQYLELYLRSRREAGWLKESDDCSWAVAEAREMLRVATAFPAGAIVEKRGDTIQARKTTMNGRARQ